jgi:hypothetical protein
MSTSLAQRADYRSEGYAARDAYAVADGILYLRLAALKTFEDCDALIAQLREDEIDRYGEYTCRVARTYASREDNR